MGASLTVSPITNLNNQTRDATHVFVHPNYNIRTLVNDIAIIRVRVVGTVLFVKAFDKNFSFIQVSPPFTFTSSFYNSSRIESTPAVNYSCSVAGWGTLTNVSGN